MSGLRICLVLLGACAATAACTDLAPSNPPAPVAAKQVAPPAPVNGTYNGITQLVSGPAMSCGTQDVLTIRVADNAFSYTLQQPEVPWQPLRSFQVMITPDGSFQAQSGPAYIRGTVAGGHMAGDIVGDACGYHFEGDSTGTW